MKNNLYYENESNAAIFGGIAGLLAIASYLINIFADLPLAVTFLLAMTFPIFGIMFLYGIKVYVEGKMHSHFNELSFVFGSLAFTICGIFLSAQIAIQNGIDLQSPSENTADLKLIKSSLRLIDMGMDVAWDMFIGTSLVLQMFAMRKLKELRMWGYLLGILGAALMVLNTITFPTPPADANMVDLGPAISLSWIGLSLQLIRLGLKRPSLT